jgi:hypothetical protein
MWTTIVVLAAIIVIAIGVFVGLRIARATTPPGQKALTPADIEWQKHCSSYLNQLNQKTPRR